MSIKASTYVSLLFWFWAFALRARAIALSLLVVGAFASFRMSTTAARWPVKNPPFASYAEQLRRNSGSSRQKETFPVMASSLRKGQWIVQYTRNRYRQLMARACAGRAARPAL